jgi:Zn-dependent protease
MESADNAVGLVVRIALWALPVLSAVILHEVSHGFVALRLGDDTALRMGRLTLNPLPHIDPVGTVLLPGILLALGGPVFGWAKPVPVDYRNLRDPRRGMVLVALAGPLTNLTLAVLAAAAYHGLGMLADGEGWPALLARVVRLVAMYAVLFNLVLAVFNLLPIPPLDGGRVLTGILPFQAARLVARLEPLGFPILMVLLMTRSLGAVLNAPVRVLLEWLL